MQCIHCNSAILTPLFCDSCNKVLEVAPNMQNDYYAFLAMPKNFEISISHLESQYLIMQMKLHPDRFARKSEEEKRMAVETSAFVNIAYAALKNDFSRAEHMLLLAGIDIKDENYMQDDMEFLDLAFQWRELSMTQDQRALSKLVLEVKDMRAKFFIEFSRLYNAKEFKDAAQFLQKVRFLDRLLTDL
ncbi:MAG: Fe-S protein assembly co-chaperone HscB [Alphaproteobacteria bacterium]